VIRGLEVAITGCVSQHCDLPNTYAHTSYYNDPAFTTLSRADRFRDLFASRSEVIPWISTVLKTSAILEHIPGISKSIFIPKIKKSA
jgi:hypothetical protein